VRFSPDGLATISVGTMAAKEAREAIRDELWMGAASKATSPSNSTTANPNPTSHPTLDDSPSCGYAVEQARVLRTAAGSCTTVNGPSSILLKNPLFSGSEAHGWSRLVHGDSPFEKPANPCMPKEGFSAESIFTT
jgi:hypothetical protein